LGGFLPIRHRWGGAIAQQNAKELQRCEAIVNSCAHVTLHRARDFDIVP
jgi:hypothetical protein